MCFGKTLTERLRLKIHMQVLYNYQAFWGKVTVQCRRGSRHNYFNRFMRRQFIITAKKSANASPISQRQRGNNIK